MDAIISQQLPLLKFTVAKLFALATICVFTYYSYLNFRVDYVHLFSQYQAGSESYFVVTNSALLLHIVLVGCGLTAIYLFLPQLNQILGTIVFGLASIGAFLMAWSDWFALHNLQKMSYYPKFQTYYSMLSTLSLVFLSSALILLIGHSVYDIYNHKSQKVNHHVLPK